MNFKKLAVSVLVGAASAGVLAAGHVLSAALPIAAPVVTGAAIAVAHYIDAFGSKS